MGSLLLTETQIEGTSPPIKGAATVDAPMKGDATDDIPASQLKQEDGKETDDIPTRQA